MRALELLKLKGHLSALVALAASNAPIDAGAKLIYDNLPDDMIELLFADNWFEGLSILAPECVAYKEWLAKVRDATLPMFDGPEDEAIDTTGNTAKTT